MSRFPGMVCSLLVFSALQRATRTALTKHPQANWADDRKMEEEEEEEEDAATDGPYFLYSEAILMTSSVEILLLSCLKSGEKRDSLSSVPRLSLNTDLSPTTLLTLTSLQI